MKDDPHIALTAKFGPILKAAFPDEHSVTRFQVANALAEAALSATQSSPTDSNAPVFAELWSNYCDLKARNADLLEALEPFATFAETFVDDDGWTGPMKQERIVDWFGPTDFRRAKAAYDAAIAQHKGQSK